MGAPEATHSFSGIGDSGAAFILSSDDGGLTWSADATLEIPFSASIQEFAPSDGDFFGSAVAIEGDLTVVGAPGYDEASVGVGDDRGIAMVAGFDGNWSVLTTLPGDWDNPVNERGLGLSVGILDGLIAVGAPGDVVSDGPGTGGSVASGTVRLARVVGNAVIETTRLVPRSPSGVFLDLEGLRFGESVRLFGQALAVGAPADGPGAVLDPHIEVHLLDPSGISLGVAASIEDPSIPATTVAAAINDDGLPSVGFGTVAGPASAGAARLLRGPLPTGGGVDENENGIVDVCEIAAGLAEDCNQDCRIDAFEIADDATLDCDQNGHLDSCDVKTAEIVWILDGSLSTDTKGQIICDDLIAGLESELAAFGIATRSTILGITAGCTEAPCIDPGQTVEELYGTAVPLPDNDTDYSAVSVLASNTCESWAAATAIVAQSHPWQSTLRIVVPIADECAWNGGDVPVDCDMLDDLSVEAAGLFADCRDVFVLPIQTPGLGGTPFAPVTVQMQEIATLTSGVRFELPDLAPAFVDAVRVALATAVRTRTLVLDFDPYLPDGSGGATFGNDVLDDCEIQADPAAFPDCNGNGIDDTIEILLGDPTWTIGDPADLGLVTSSVDLDGNGILDLCEAACCPGDLDRDGFVEFADLLIVLNNFECTGGDPYADFCDLASFPPSPCPGDVDGDGDTDFQDILGILNTFDACFVQGAPPCAVIRRSMIAPPQSVLDCLQRANWDPVKAAACIDALNLVGAQP